MTDDEDFLQAMQGVQRLNKSSVPPARPRRSVNRALRSEIQQRAARSATEFGENLTIEPTTEYAGHSNSEDDQTLFYLRHGVQKKVLRDLKKGLRYPVRQVLDLHGLTRDNAKIEIDRALAEFDSASLACILIIHGKGFGSSQGPVLKNFTSAYLKRLAQVRAYCSASIQDGGTGALYVLLKGA